jgi:2-polyprenyl-3-methyl-5-hydroxy-6-metoxy-1,4-benzoquinol methylase
MGPTVKAYLQHHRLISTNIATYHQRTRDRDDVPVYRCAETGVIFVDVNTEAIDRHYIDKTAENDGRISVKKVGGQTINLTVLEDSVRRVKQFGSLIASRDVCDFGTGAGLFLREAKRLVNSISGIELNCSQAEALRADGFRIEDRIEGLDLESLDVMTLFHTLEHLAKPIETLAQIRTRLRPGGQVIVEVPHANHFLHRTLESEAF